MTVVMRLLRMSVCISVSVRICVSVGAMVVRALVTVSVSVAMVVINRTVFVVHMGVVRVRCFRFLFLVHQ